MIEVVNATYLGLPVPTLAEAKELQRFAFKNQRSSADLNKLAKRVIEARPLIEDVIEDEISSNLYERREDDLTEDEKFGLEAGIKEGYNFTIGCMTYAYYLRDQQSTSLPEFFDSLPNNSQVLPVRKISQLRRVTAWHAGVLEYELTDDDIDYMGDDKNHGLRDSINYIKHAAAFTSLFDRKLAQLMVASACEPRSDIQDPQGQIYDGYNIAITNCIEMYIQSHEQDTLDQLKY